MVRKNTSVGQENLQLGALNKQEEASEYETVSEKGELPRKTFVKPENKVVMDGTKGANCERVEFWGSI